MSSRPESQATGCRNRLFALVMAHRWTSVGGAQSASRGRVRIDAQNDLDNDRLCADEDPCPTDARNDSDNNGLCDVDECAAVRPDSCLAVCGCYPRPVPSPAGVGGCMVDVYLGGSGGILVGSGGTAGSSGTTDGTAGSGGSTGGTSKGREAETPLPTGTQSLRRVRRRILPCPSVRRQRPAAFLPRQWMGRSQGSMRAALSLELTALASGPSRIVGRLGVRTDRDRIYVPGYLLQGGDDVARRDAQGRLYVSLGADQRATLRDLPLPSGRFAVQVAADGATTVLVLTGGHPLALHERATFTWKDDATPSGAVDVQIMGTAATHVFDVMLTRQPDGRGSEDHDRLAPSE